MPYTICLYETQNGKVQKHLIVHCGCLLYIIVGEKFNAKKKHCVRLMDGYVSGLGLLRNPVGKWRRGVQLETLHKRQTQFISAVQSFITVFL